MRRGKRKMNYVKNDKNKNFSANDNIEFWVNVKWDIRKAVNVLLNIRMAFWKTGKRVRSKRQRNIK